MSLISKVYSADVPSSPINKQAAVGCMKVGSAYDEKPFHPLSGKGCLKYALKNCRRSSGRQELVNKIASGCQVPVLEVVHMVDEWLVTGRAVWREGELVVVRKKLSEDEKAIITAWLLVRPKVVSNCQALKGKIETTPSFFIGKMKDGSYDVIISNGPSWVLFTEWVGNIAATSVSLRGSFLEVVCEYMMLRQEFGKLVELEGDVSKSGIGRFRKALRVLKRNPDFVKSRVILLNRV